MAGRLLCQNARNPSAILLQQIRSSSAVSCYDLISGQQLCEAGKNFIHFVSFLITRTLAICNSKILKVFFEFSDSSAVKTRCTFNVATGKLVVVNDKCIGARKDFNGIYLLDSILQPPQADPNATVVLELPLNQVLYK